MPSSPDDLLLFPEDGPQPADTGAAPENPVPKSEIQNPKSETALSWSAIFSRSAQNAVEIGTGNGYFIENEAARLPDWNFIGVERDREFFGKMIRRCRRRGLTNVRATSIDAFDLLERLPDASVDRIYLYFSDPWPKRRHARRRVFGPPFLEAAERVLAPGGEVRFKTDVGWYFNLAVTDARLRPGWTLSHVGNRPPPDEAVGEIYSNYESKARKAGIQVWGFTATPGASGIYTDPASLA
jgi:tRNA (guanine-N7-)-methyltransferase